MNDERDLMLRKRFAALDEPPGHPDWADVERRAGDLAADTPPAGPRRRRALRALGGVAAVGVALCVALLLLVTTRGGSDTAPADGEAIHSVYQRVITTPTPGRPIVTEAWIDFDRRVARITSRVAGDASGRVADITLVTPDRTYLHVPDDLRGRTGGRSWIASPTTAATLARVFDRGYLAAPSVERLGGPAGTHLTNFGSDTLGGVAVTKLIATPVNYGGDSLTVWVDGAGRLRRSERTFVPATPSVTTEVVSYDEAPDITAPAAADIVDTPTPETPALVMPAWPPFAAHFDGLATP